MRPCEALYATFLAYIASNGRRLVSLARALGQDEVLIELRALFKYHDPSTGFRKLEEAAERVLESAEEKEGLGKLGLRIVKKDDSIYLVTTVEELERKVKELEAS